MSDYAVIALGEALLELMQDSDIEKVTVDALAAWAGIGRATYFRNFKSKEEVLARYIALKWRRFESENRLDERRIDDPYRVRRYFEFCYAMRAANDAILRQNRAGVILNAYELIFGTYGDSYESAFTAYGLYGVLLKWAQTGYRQTPEEMTEIVIERIFSGAGLEGM